MTKPVLPPAESRLLVYLSILGMIALQIAVSNRLTLGPKYLLTGLELLLLMGSAVTHATGKANLKHIKRKHRERVERLETSLGPIKRLINRYVRL